MYSLSLSFLKSFDVRVPKAPVSSVHGMETRVEVSRDAVEVRPAEKPTSPPRSTEASQAVGPAPVGAGRVQTMEPTAPSDEETP